jgi:hypothetical protein
MSAGRRTVMLLALVCVVACAGVALAKSPAGPPGLQPKDEAAARHLALERQAIDLINAADRHVYATVRGCKPNASDLGHAKATHDAPSPAVLDALAPLRRPATPDELNDARHPGALGGGETYVDYVRHVSTADGHPLTIVIGRRAAALFRLPKRCFDAEHARLVHLLKGKPPKLRSVALEEFSHIRQGQEANSAQPTTPVDGIYLFDRGGGGGGADIAFFRERGVFVSIGSRLNGLLPDGVASVTLEFPKVIHHGRYYKPTVFPSAFTTTVTVHDNVLSVAVPRPAGAAFPHRMVWRDAAGSIVHTFTDSQT